jgi:ketosteroid isomerase-like protein
MYHDTEISESPIENEPRTGAHPARTQRSTPRKEDPVLSNHEHPNALLILQCWQAASQGDAETLRAIWADDIVWHATSDSPWKGDHIGVNSVLDYLSRVGEMGELYELTLQSVLANEDYGLVAFHVNSEMNGETLSANQILFGQFKNGRISEIWTLALDREAVEVFWKNAGF